MKVSPRILGAAAGALLLAGCAVPGQPGAPGSAAELGDTVVTNERVTELYDAWLNEAQSPANRRQVITLELMREPLLNSTDLIDYTYSRTLAEQQAEIVVALTGSTEPPSEAMIDGIESAFLIGAFVFLTEDSSILEGIALEVEADAVTNARTGDFNAAAFIASVEQASQQAAALAQSSDPTWILPFNDVNGMVEPETPWISVQ